MAFSQTDLDAIETALLDHAVGKTVIEVSIAGRVWKYAAAESDRFEKLLAMRNLIARELGLVPSTLHLKNGRRVG